MVAAVPSELRKANGYGKNCCIWAAMNEFVTLYRRQTTFPKFERA